VEKTPALGPGLSQDETSSENFSPDTADRAHRQRQPVDPRKAWLLRAASRYDLLRTGTMTLDEVFDPQFIDDFLTATGACPCQRGIDQHFDQIHRQDREQHLRRWRQSQPPREQHRPAQSTIDAYQYLVRLNDPEKLRAFLESPPELTVWLKVGR
jgi:hypothetical protein